MKRKREGIEEKKPHPRLKKKRRAGKTSSVRNVSPVRSNDEIINYKTQLTQVGRFFDSVIKSYDFNENTDIKFVLVNHIVPTLPHFLEAISEIGTVALIIPKSSHADPDIKKVIKEKYPKAFYDSTNDGQYKLTPGERIDDWFIESNKGENCIEFLKAKLDLSVSGNDKFIIIDIGGYFAKSLPYIYQDKELKTALLGVVEDTENGHQKYVTEISNNWDGFTTDSKDNSKKSFPFPVFSVARNRLKETEDYNVGKSIVESASTLLREDAHTILERMKTIGVIGFGKIGRSIAEHLRQKNVANVVVYELDSIRQMNASSVGFKVANREILMAESDMIFCATGNKSLTGFDFCHLKDNVFIASCTSSNDELGLEYITSLNKEIHKNEYNPEEKNIAKYYTSEEEKKGKRINLLYNGNAVNFVHGAVNGPYIYSVQAALVVSSIKIIKDKEPKKHVIKNDTSQQIQLLEIDKNDMQNIAAKWLDCFEGFKYSNNDFVLNDPEIYEQLNSGISDIINKYLFYFHICLNLISNFKTPKQLDNDEATFKLFCYFYNLCEQYKNDENFDGKHKTSLEEHINSFWSYRTTKNLGINRNEIENQKMDEPIKIIFDRRLFLLVIYLYDQERNKDVTEKDREFDGQVNLFYYAILSCCRQKDKAKRDEIVGQVSTNNQKLPLFNKIKNMISSNKSELEKDEDYKLIFKKNKGGN